MPTTAEVLREFRAEHAALAPHVEALRIAGDAVSLPSARDAFELVDEAWRFASEHLLVHARAEEHTIYAAFTRSMGSPEATRLLTIDHEWIAQLVNELGELRRAMADHDTLHGDLANALRRVLYGLYAVVRPHFEKEETVVLPVLEVSLTASEAERLQRAMAHYEHAHH